MLISFNWLKEHCDLPAGLTPVELGDKFKLAVVEVEKIVSEGENLENIVVGKVVSAVKHSNADKLKVCKVDAGGELVQVVCGGSNVTEGILVAFAPVGAKVRWHGEGDLVELTEATIRGEKSYGMICASTEIGLGEKFPLKDEKEILDLTFLKLKAGTPLKTALKLNDAVLEIDNKSLSHRPDLWGHFGLAREAAALFNRQLKELSAKGGPASGGKIKPGKSVSLSVKVEDTKLCPRYLAVALTGIKVAPSPDWLQSRLLAVGINPINNIVDITNYVMLDLGQPMHAFDISKIKYQKSKIAITVRPAQSGETFVALDKKEYKLTENDLVITDGERSVAIAGVMGGLDSGVTDTTETIIFESANFNPVAVRKTSTRLNLRSDSAQRFEKSLDPNLCEIALQKAVAMTLAICPGASVASKVIDEKHFSLFTGPLLMPKNIFEKKLGVVIPPKRIKEILEKLGFVVTEKKDELSVKIPTWRATKDIQIAEDIVEEVGRIYGFSNILGTLPTFPITPASLTPVQKLQRLVKDVLVRELGYSEMYNYAFVSGAQINNLGDDIKKYLELDNPLSKEKPYLRRNLLPNLLENAAKNLPNREVVKIFEVGKVFRPDVAGERTEKNSNELLPRQDTWLTGLYASKGQSTPFFEARRVLESLTSVGHLILQTIAPDKVQPWEHSGRLALVKAGESVVGVISELNPAVSTAYGIDTRVVMITLNLTELANNLEKCQKNVLYKSASIYPEVERDVAFVVDTKIVHADVVSALSEIDPLIKAVELFDVYVGKSLGGGVSPLLPEEGARGRWEKKSMAYRLTLLNSERTLESKEVDVVMDKAEKMLVKKFEAEMRK
ncbi:MAG: phenylalanine--tRNA ligase subunit beta [Candidatus Magasanikbacteria bacterium RIFOXYD2_FULL_41_14]|uniref:Phenylalanine--tRNA ligase beta subunit n=1 Tax=Candidatus Magasanikbacteria bacterium RIFOXYD2_FULL_41_14 TaxID=1798709 RepID=A0A1F6PEE8_9BACT|nr:MAG: phenylalanine--tRNA ligase subunit beta [Candidatus Magasanikbacteria bacterium RIFOXYD2_FULL_41_14]